MKKSVTILFLSFVAWCCTAIAEEKKGRPSDQPTNEQQENALKALAAARSEVVTFVSGFRDTSFRVYPVDRKSGRTQIDLTVTRGGYMIMLSFDGRFDTTFTKVGDTQFRFFWVILTDGSASKFDVKLSELTSLCDDPDGFVASKRKKG